MSNIFETIDARRITPSTEVQPHQFLFTWNDIPCFARGELVALTGKAKSGKTYVCSILMALAVKRQLMGLQRLQDEPMKVVWIDTEQSADSTQEILCIRIASLIGQSIPDNQYFVYNLRPDNWQDRLSLVLACISKHQPDLVIFDGIRDVVGDINNYQEAQTVLGKLLSIASWSNACIVCVLHQNKSLEDKTLRGALGTELQNKSFETYECQKDPDTRIFTMRQIATRKYDITHKLEFTVNQEGLPVEEAKGDESMRREAGSNYAERINAAEMIPKIFGNERVISSIEFKQKVRRLIPELAAESSYLQFLREAYNLHLIQKHTTENKENFYEICQPIFNSQETGVPSLF
jgi:hypothetical protein